jgi:hypothetical protein
MWAGLYLIAVSVIMLGMVIACPAWGKRISRIGWKIFGLGWALFPFITIAYGINLIINS